MRAARLLSLAAGILGVSFLAFPARADVVELKNGNVMNGSITRETSTELDVDIGYGSVTLQKSDILRVRRADAQSRRKQERELRRRRLENGEGLPADGAPLYAAYRRMSELRDKVAEARARGDSSDQDRAGLISEIKDLGRRRQSVLEQLAGTDPNGPDYNALVVEINDLGAQGSAKQTALTQMYEDSEADDATVKAYMNSFNAFRRARDEYAGRKTAAADHAEFGAVMQDVLRRQEKDFRRDLVAVKRSGTNMIADVTLNGKTRVRLLVDTGASLVTLSPEILAALGPGVIRRGTIQTTVADGRSVPAEEIELDSVETGGARARHVAAAVMSGRLQGVDGLLGMSFLGRFAFEARPEEGAMILSSLKEPAAVGAPGPSAPPPAPR